MKCVFIKKLARCFLLPVAFVALNTALGTVCVSCGDSGKSTEDNTLTVSIEPLHYIVDQIVGDDFRVNVLVPPGASPEMYEPTPLRISAAEDSQLVFSTGLIGFETAVMDRLASPERFVDLSVGIGLIAESPGHNDPESPADGHSHVHDGGVDPHIWISPKSLLRMARTSYERIHELYPDSISYTTNYTRFCERLTALDREVSEYIAASGISSFMVFHPGLTYYARDYGLWQIALESDGKEPSSRQLAGLIELARTENISKVLYQSEFPRRTVEIVAAEIGATPVEIDILGYDIVDNILKITEIITK